MSIQNYNVIFPGQGNDIRPRLARLHATNTKAEVKTAGYLDNYVNSQGASVQEGDFVFVEASDGNDICTPSIAADGVITLTSLL